MEPKKIDAIIDRTKITIGNDKINSDFVAKGEVISFEGFMKVYLEGKDDVDDEKKVCFLTLN